MTQNGDVCSVDKWDLMIAHPPCTYLSNVATRAYSLRVTPAEKVVQRWDERAKAAIFFMQLRLAPIERIAVENPVGYMNSAYEKAAQIIDPYMFTDSMESDEYVTKRTCLWLKNLPRLERTNDFERPDNRKVFGTYSNGKAKTWEETRVGNRAKVRSKTFEGIAKAMAEQWG